MRLTSPESHSKLSQRSLSGGLKLRNPHSAPLSCPPGSSMPGTQATRVPCCSGNRWFSGLTGSDLGELLSPSPVSSHEEFSWNPEGGTF